jgi:hypothetical protein
MNFFALKALCVVLRVGQTDHIHVIIQLLDESVTLLYVRLDEEVSFYGC